MKWDLKENTRLLIAVTSAISAATGASAAYVVATKVLRKKFQAIADAEIQEAKVYYQGLYSRPVMVEDEPDLVEVDVNEEFDALPVATKERLIQDAITAFKGYSPTEGDPENAQDDRPIQVVNIFQNNVPPGEEVLAALMADRDPEEPYIITKAEFYENEPEHEQEHFTYYEGDGILVDDKDEYHPIQDTDPVAGDDNLLRFGYGSGDEHTLYIRNETMKPPMDLYITRSTGRYMVEVMGADNDDSPQLKHSQPRRFRTRDE